MPFFCIDGNYNYTSYVRNHNDSNIDNIYDNEGNYHKDGIIKSNVKSKGANLSRFDKFHDI